MSNQVCVISIYVPNIQEAVDFYTNILGFEVNKEYGSKIVSLVHEQLPIVLEESEKATYQQEGVVSGVSLGLRTEDINETLISLKEKEVNFIIDEPTDCPPGKYISLTDPFGNIIDFLQFDMS